MEPDFSFHTLNLSREPQQTDSSDKDNLGTAYRHWSPWTLVSVHGGTEVFSDIANLSKIGWLDGLTTSLRFTHQKSCRACKAEKAPIHAGTPSLGWILVTGLQ